MSPKEMETKASDLKLLLENYAVPKDGYMELSTRLYSQVYSFLADLDYFGVREANDGTDSNQK